MHVRYAETSVTRTRPLWRVWWVCTSSFKKRSNWRRRATIARGVRATSCRTPTITLTYNIHVSDTTHFWKDWFSVFWWHPTMHCVWHQWSKIGHGHLQFDVPDQLTIVAFNTLYIHTRRCLNCVDQFVCWSFYWRCVYVWLAIFAHMYLHLAYVRANSLFSINMQMI